MRYEIFAKRGKSFKHDVLEYDSIPDKLRVQISYIWQDALEYKDYNHYEREKVYPHFSFIRNHLCRELGIETLYPYGANNLNIVQECEYYLKKGNDVEIWLSLVELSIASIEKYREEVGGFHVSRIKMDEEEAIAELNHRFRENGFGYEFSDGILIRKDSEYIHEEVTKPALHLLQEEGFEGALAEFLEAHEHFRKKSNKACINSASNAFESVMKTICVKRNWEVKGSGTSSQLIQALVENGLVPSYLDSYMSSLKGLSTLRNKKTGHGQGDIQLPPVPDYFVNYALHLCATNIVFLVEAYRELPEQG